MLLFFIVVTIKVSMKIEGFGNLALIIPVELVTYTNTVNFITFSNY